MQLGLMDVAFQDLKKCLELDPSNQVAFSLLQQFNVDKKLVFTGGRYIKV